MTFRAVSLAALAASLFVALPAAAEPLAADTPMTLEKAAGFTATRDWDVRQAPGIVTVIAPEGDLTLTMIDVGAAESARAAADAAARKLAEFGGRDVEQVTPNPPGEGWDERAALSYKTSPAEHKVLAMLVSRAGDRWVATAVTGSDGTLNKRGAAVSQMIGSLRPAGYKKEDFTGQKARELTPARIAELKNFMRSAMAQLQIPGVGYAFIAHGKVIEEGGLGVRDPQTGVPVDAHTKFMIASNTKGMSTLLLATLVDQGKLGWDQKVTELMPTFRLGSDEVTNSVRVRQLVCACTGLPRKDMELIFAARPTTPASDTFVQLAATEPTSKFGEVFQYNNLMASAAGFVGGHVAYPGMELGAAYDRAMQERIFAPLGMNDTTFDFARAMAADFAVPTETGLYGDLKVVDQTLNKNFYPYRPAGGAWSSSHDVARYVMLELNKGVTAEGKRLVSAANLLKRRDPNVPIGEDAFYGMGLEISHQKGVEIVHHGGSLAGYKSDWYAFPDSGIGAVLLTNSDNGQALLGPFARKMMEVLYGAEDRAAGAIAAAAARMASDRQTLIAKLSPGEEELAKLKLAKAYRNATLGEIRLSQDKGATRMDIGPYTAPIAVQHNPDGTSSLVVTEGFLTGSDLLVGTQDGKRTLTLRDAQHVYPYKEE